MNFLSVCSGIEAASVAWQPLGWRAVAFSEIEPFPCAVLAHHYPDTPNHGDMTKYKAWPDHAIDLLCGGTPCQSFSLAGLRKGLDDPRGNLMLTFGAIAARYRPRWLVWENVPGVLSSNGGADFAAFLRLLAKLGYGFAYRVLDAQYFGVAQRRRRVFVVACLGDWRSAAAVLFERHSLSGHPAPRRETGQEPARCLTRGSGGGQRHDGETETFVTHSLRAEGFDASEDGTGRGTPLVPVGVDVYNGALTGGLAATMGTRGSSETASGPQVLVPSAAPAIAFDCTASGMNGFGIAEETAGSLRVGTNGSGAAHSAVAIQGTDHASTYEADASSLLRTLRDRVGAEAVAEWGSRILDSLQSAEVLRAWLHGESIRRTAGHFRSFVDDCPLPREEGVPARALRDVWENGPDGRSSQGRGLAKQLSHQLGKALPQLPSARAPQQSTTQVRRLTPRECERLMGFPDGYTDVPWRGKRATDGPRYKALGNSWAVPCARWIGRRIDAVEAVAHLMEAA